MIAHLLYQASDKNSPERLLGLVVDPGELAKLQSEDDDAMPVLGRLQECTAVRGEDGALYVLGVVRMTEAIPEFTVAAYQAADARKAADVAALRASSLISAEMKAELKLAEFKSDAQARSERASSREARRLEEEAQT